MAYPVATPEQVESFADPGYLVVPDAIDRDELALLDVREEGVFSQAHLLWASSVPLSRIELLIADLVPRRAARIVLCDGADGLADRAAARLGSFGYSSVAILDGGIDGWRAAGANDYAGRLPTAAELSVSPGSRRDVPRCDRSFRYRRCRWPEHAGAVVRL